MPAHPHQCFVDGDTHKPGVKTRISSKLRQVSEDFYKRVLHYFFSIFAVMSNALGQTEYPPLVAPDELFKCRYGSAFCLRDELCLVDFNRRTVGMQYGCLQVKSGC